MELVIKLDDETYKEVLNRTEFDTLSLGVKLIEAVQNGIQLPKGHGRLIDEPTEEEIAKTIGGKNDFADCIREAVKTVFANAPTIIEADKENKE